MPCGGQYYCSHQNFSADFVGVLSEDSIFMDQLGVEYYGLQLPRFIATCMTRMFY